MSVFLILLGTAALMAFLKWLTREPWGNALICETWGMIIITLAGREYRQRARAILQSRSRRDPLR